MTQEELKLQNHCENVAKEVGCICQKYAVQLSDCKKVMHLLKKAENRSLEYENGSFIILVVGPVKSGKSTLVNLIANAYVSPTHFLECTVRPSIISQRKEDKSCKIVVYTSKNKGNRIEQIDTVIDCIRGIEKEEDLQYIERAEFDLTKDNIKQKVELDLKESIDDETLVTSITTPGGLLMKPDVFIVDMPGFDGAYANLDDPVYDTIAQRADLIIFVQSSNSAISKLSGAFLEKLSNNNQKVPVCLIHNVFESAWWRCEEERNAAILMQKNFAINEIQKKLFHIDENQCFSINLGKVEDSRKALYADNQELIKEAIKFKTIEGELYERIISRRDLMRLQVCQSRTNQQVKKTITAINEELDRRHKLEERYQSLNLTFDKIGDTPQFHSMQSSLDVDYTSIKHIIYDEARSYKDVIATENHRSDTEARIMVYDFVGRCERDVTASFGKSLSLDHKEQELFLESENYIAKLREAISNEGFKPKEIVLEKQTIDNFPCVLLSDGVPIDALIPRRFITVAGLIGGHSAEEVFSYINKVARRLAGSLPDESEVVEGYIEKPGGAISEVVKQVNFLLNEVSTRYAEKCRNFWKHSKAAALSEIIIDKEKFDAETKNLLSLKEDVTRLEQLL